MGTSAEVSLLLKNGKEYIICTPVDGGYCDCGKHLWEWLGSLLSKQWDTLNERLEKATWAKELDKACTHGLTLNRIEFDLGCPRESTKYTMIDVLRREYYEPFQVLRSVMNGRTRHMIHFESGYACYDYQIDFNSKTFSVSDSTWEYVNVPFTCKIARLLFESTVNLDERMSPRDDSLTNTDAAAQVQVSPAEMEAHCTALEPSKLEDQTGGESEPQSTDETLREGAEKEPEAMVDVQGNGLTEALDGQWHVEVVPLAGTATPDVGTESVGPETVPMDLSTAPNHELGPGDSAMDTVSSVETHIQPGQTVQLSENCARSEATEATEVATPRSQELGSPTNPILLQDDPPIVGNDKDEPIIIE